MAGDRIIELPIKESKIAEIKEWCGRNTPGRIIKVISRPSEFRDVFCDEEYDFYMFAFSSTEELFLFKLMYPFDASEWEIA